MPKNNITKYLSQFSHAADLAQFPQKPQWQSVLIIPVCGESPTFLESVMRCHEQSSVLIVLCLNRPENHLKTESWRSENQSLLNYIKNQSINSTQVGTHHYFEMPAAWDCLLLNFNKTPFDANHGVGLARKIAADTALALIERQQIQLPWIYSTDADVTLPVDYFGTMNEAPNASAISLPFEHISDHAELQKLQQHYDYKMYYYQWGMKQIGVAYDYIPLGSTLVVAAKAYATVRGFPIKSGGEDFYLLNKLAKIGHIAQPNNPVISIKTRISDRVPFGTGPALQQYKASNEVPFYYNPECFEVIKHWRLKLLAQYGQADIMDAATDGENLLNQFWSWSNVYSKNKRQIKTEQRWQQFIHEWLDAFKLLKSVHELRKVYPDVLREKIPFRRS